MKEDNQHLSNHLYLFYAFYIIIIRSIDKSLGGVFYFIATFMALLFFFILFTSVYWMNGGEFFAYNNMHGLYNDDDEWDDRQLEISPNPKSENIFLFVHAKSIIKKDSVEN